jgi:hypothetical protein
MSDYGWDVGSAANEAFSSPTNLTASRLGNRIVTSDSSVSSSGKSVSSKSRRSPSIIISQDEADLFDQMTQATSVKVRSKKNKKLSEAAAAISPTSGHSNQYNSEDFLTSPNSNGSMYSADFNQGEKFFQPGGPLSISSPGQVEEKVFHWKKGADHQPHHLDVPPLEEKKSTDHDEQERKPTATQSKKEERIELPTQHPETESSLQVNGLPANAMSNDKLKQLDRAEDGAASHTISVSATKKLKQNQSLVETVNGSGKFREGIDRVCVFLVPLSIDSLCKLLFVSQKILMKSWRSAASSQTQ